MNKKLLMVILLLLVLVAIFGVFLLNQQKDKHGKINVSISNGTHIISGLLAIADQEGFFSDEGVEVNIELYGSGAKAFSAQKNGEYDMSTVAETPVVLSKFEEDEYQILATIGTTDNEQKVVARIDSGIRTVSDLRGKKIAVHRKGSSPHFFAYLFLLSNRLSFDDVDLVIVPVDDLVFSLVSGEVDAIASSEPLASDAKNTLGENGILFSASGLYNRSYNLVSSKKFIKDKPYAVERILRALVKAEEFAKKNPSQAIKDISVKFQMDESVVQESWSNYNLEVTLTQSLLTMLDDQARWLIQEGLATGPNIPNYLNAVYITGLEKIKPEAVTIIR